MKVLVTGAGGYVGSRLVRALEAAGHEVVAGGRRPVAGLPFYPFDLAQAVAAPLPPGTRAVVHLAAHTGGGLDAALAAQEVTAAQMLLAAARTGGARFVFVSSQTARVDAPTAYGRTKWRIEQLVSAAGGVGVRPGQVYGGATRGLFGTLVGMVERLPLLPAFVPAPRIQPVHVDDLAAALVALVERTELPPRLYAIGAPAPVTFTRFLAAIAQGQVRRRRLFVPVPTALVRLASRLGGGRVAPLERLRSLFALPLLDCGEDLAILRISLRSLDEGMARGQGYRRRAVLAESRALLQYVLGERPGNALVRRQTHAVEALRGGLPLGLPGLAARFPATLRCLEGLGGGAQRQQEFNWRLDCATAVAEASTQGARRLLGLPARGGAVRAASGLARAVAAEVFWRLAGPAVRPLLRWR